MTTEKNSSPEEKLGTDPLFPLIFRMALPAMAAQLVNLLYGIVDRVYIGHIPEIGSDALAGVGVTNAVILIVAAFANFVGGGGTPLAAIALGRNDRGRAEKILHNGVILLAVFSALTMALCYMFLEPTLRFAGASDVTLPYAKSYLSIYLAGTPFVMAATGLNLFISCQGHPKTAMLAVVIGAALNTALDPLFIYTFGMGVAGAALATVISQAVSAVFVVGWLASPKSGLRLRLSGLAPDYAVIGQISALGVSPFVMAITESLVGFILNGSLARFGDIYVSALTVMQSAMQFVMVPINGFQQGYSPVVSYNYGHGDVARVKKSFRIGLCFMSLFHGAGILLTILLPGTVAKIFTDDPLLIDTVSRYMPLFLAGMTIFGLQRCCQQTFVALGQAKISLFIALLRKVILLVPLALILPRLLGDVAGVYLAESVADATAALICTAIFFSVFPKILRRTSSADHT